MRRERPKSVPSTRPFQSYLPGKLAYCFEYLIKPPLQYADLEDEGMRDRKNHNVFIGVVMRSTEPELRKYYM